MLKGLEPALVIHLAGSVWMRQSPPRQRDDGLSNTFTKLECEQPL